MKVKILAVMMTAVLAIGSITGCSTGSSTTEETSGTTEASGGTVTEPVTEEIVVQESVEAEAVEEKGASITVGIAADPVSLAPWVAMSFGGIATRRTIYEFLIDREGFGGEMQGILMKSYEKVAEHTYNLTIYDYIYDSAGNHMTAADVAYSYNKAIELGNLPKLSIIDVVEVVDDYTVRFVFNKELALGELDAIWSEAPVVTQKAYEASPDGMSTTPVGTSAYVVKEYISGSKIILENTGNYWQDDTSLYAAYAYNNWDAITFEIITEGAQLAIALETGAIDISSHIASQEIARFAEGGDSSEGMKVSSYYENTAIALMPNCDPTNPLSDLALREAVFYAIDSAQVLAGAYNGKGMISKTYGASVYGDFQESWDEADYFDYSLEMAKEKMAEAGFEESNLTLRLLALNDEDVIEAATIIQAFLLQIGIDTEIMSYETAMYNNQLADVNAWDLAIATQASSDYIVNLWKLMYDINNYNGEHSLNFIVDPELQSLLETCISVEGHTPENIDAFHQYVYDNAYGYGICSSVGYIAHSENIESVVLDFRNQVMPGSCKPAVQ